MARRPEHQAPPEIFYNESEARKYTTSSQIIKVQGKLTDRALEMLALPEDDTPKFLLDIGCGSGLSGEALSESGHHWLGIDISPDMLDVAVERECDGDLVLGDIGQGLGLRPGVIDGAISISVLQWLCNADKSSHDPRKRLKCFFQSLYTCLNKGARAVLQLYPESLAQLEMINNAAMRCGFSGGVVVDYPHSTRAKKYYLCLISGPPNAQTALPKAKEEESDSDDDGSDDEGRQAVAFSGRERPRKRAKVEKQGKIKGREWVIKKKEQRRKAGHAVPPNTRYTGQKRKSRF